MGMSSQMGQTLGRSTLETGFPELQGLFQARQAHLGASEEVVAPGSGDVLDSRLILCLTASWSAAYRN